VPVVIVVLQSRALKLAKMWNVKAGEDGKRLLVDETEGMDLIETSWAGSWFDPPGATA
jgi:hypothetical protein